MDLGGPWWTLVVAEGLAFEVNAHAPAFVSDVYHASVPENNEVGVQLTRVEATDDDRYGNRIRYRLADAAGNSQTARLFAVDTDTGVVTAAVSFDRERTMTVEATVVAEDSGHPPLSASALLIVTVRDLDDERPAFKQQRYRYCPPILDVKLVRRKARS